MADGKLAAFNSRVRRIEKDHTNGYGFEAVGTLGRSHYRPRRRLRLPVAGPLLVIVALVVVMKALIQLHLGAGLYQERVDRLWLGNPAERIGAVLMQPDPLSLWLAGRLGRAV